MSSPIEVLELRPVTTAGNVKAFVKLRIGAVVLHGCKIVRQEGQHAWVSLPQTKSGERWFPVVEITSKDLRERVSAVVLEAWQAQRQEIIPPTRTAVHRNERQDPREAHVDALAKRFDERGPDDPEDAIG